MNVEEEKRSESDGIMSGIPEEHSEFGDERSLTPMTDGKMGEGLLQDNSENSVAKKVRFKIATHGSFISGSANKHSFMS